MKSSILWSLAAWAALSQQKAGTVEHVLKPELTLIEREEAKRLALDTWIIDEFMFKPPRMITVEVPGKGRRLLWYMVYRVTNKGKVRRFVPGFRLVDDKGKAYLDVVIPKAQRAIQSREDPLRVLQSSVSVVGDLEPSTEEGNDKSVYGVAIWDGIDPATDHFDILISGLSNAYKKLEDPATGDVTTQRKMLQLKFARPGDEFNLNEREIRYLGHEWIYAK
jgi:hypothetical protein